MATTNASTMAAMTLFQVTLCLLLLVLAAQGKDDSTDAILVVIGTARCKRNCSRIISHAPLQLLIDNTTIVGTGRTTSKGKVVMTVKLTSREHVASLMANNGSSKAFLVAPPHACGEPDLPPGMIVAAPVRPVAAISASGQMLLATNDGTLLAPTNIGLIKAQLPTVASSDGSIKMIVAHVADDFSCIATLIGRLIPPR